MSITYKYRPPKPPSPTLTGAGAYLGKPDPKEVLEIRIDTREQAPLSFDSDYVKTVRDTVSVFDYALNCDNGFSIERKSLEDMVQSMVLAQSWRRELAKIEKAQARLLPVVYVVEAAFDDISEKYNYAKFSSGRVTPQYVYRKISELIYSYGVIVLFAGSRQGAAYAIALILKRRKESLRSKQ